jgi:hypothetical protein
MFHIIPKPPRAHRVGWKCVLLCSLPVLGCAYPIDLAEIDAPGPGGVNFTFRQFDSRFGYFLTESLALEVGGGRRQRVTRVRRA